MIPIKKTYQLIAQQNSSQNDLEDTQLSSIKEALETRILMAKNRQLSGESFFRSFGVWVQLQAKKIDFSILLKLFMSYPCLVKQLNIARCHVELGEQPLLCKILGELANTTNLN